MRPRMLILASFLLGCLTAIATSQQPICIDGQCYRPPILPILRQPPLMQPPTFLLQPTFEQPLGVQSTIPTGTIWLDPLQEDIELVADDSEAAEVMSTEDRFDLVTQATVRVTTGSVCGSGTVVGRDDAGNALVLTNAHVAGSTRGRTVDLERWSTVGNSERGTGTIIAAGYGRGMSIDFALLKCNSQFAVDVTPIPLADRYPNVESGVTTFGCPRCEWPSLQVLKMNRAEGQVLTWRPEAIGGRSGSSIIDYTPEGPRVVGLLTWGGGGEGLGQSTPFLLQALRGRLPASLESLPVGVREVGFDVQDSDELTICRVPASTSGIPLYWPVQDEASVQDNQDLIDAILEKPPQENGLLNRDRNRLPSLTPGPIARGVSWLKRSVLIALLCGGCGLVGFFAGRWSKSL